MVPRAIRKIADNIKQPVALIGCRTTDMSLDCCEYDLAIFSTGGNRILQTDGHDVELLYLDGLVKNHLIELDGVEVLRDSNKFELSSALRDISKARCRKALNAAGKKSLISSLFYQQKMGHTKDMIGFGMWLKLAAYESIEGLLALSGSRPMPLHELAQVRRIDVGSATEGAEVALECIGIERATRSTIMRSVEAIKELKSQDYDLELFLSKAEYLLDHSMLTDCYYYAGRVAAKNLEGRKDLFHNQYPKLVQLALDLSSDTQYLEKLKKGLSKAARASLKR